MSRSLSALGGLGLVAFLVVGGVRAADVETGKTVFAKCSACHAVGEGAKNKIGPALNKIFGRKAGSGEGYKYSKAMIDSGDEGLVWDEATLKSYLAKPQDTVKGTKMAFSGLKSEEDLANVIAYLATFSEQTASAESIKEAAMTTAAKNDQGSESAAEENPAAEMEKPEPSEVGAGKHFKLGRLAEQEEVAAWDIDVRPDGLGLPEGRGTVARGMEIYDQSCASCHGDFGEAVGRWPVLAGGQGTLDDERPEKTIGSYWPFLSTVYDYVRRAMPFGNARSLSNNDVYALTAYLLYLNDVVTEESFELSKDNFVSIKLPNEGNFIDDNRKEEPFNAKKVVPCMENCRPDKATIKTHAAILDVTPEDAGEDDQPAGGSID